MINSQMAGKMTNFVANPFLEIMLNQFVNTIWVTFFDANVKHVRTFTPTLVPTTLSPITPLPMTKRWVITKWFSNTINLDKIIIFYDVTYFFIIS